MSEAIKTSEAIREISRFKKVFEATEKLQQVLASVNGAERAVAASQNRKEKIEKEIDSLNKEVDRLNQLIAQFNEKRKKDIQSLNEQYDKRFSFLKNDFNVFAKDLQEQKKALQDDFNKTKLEHDHKIHDMQKEAYEINNALISLTKTREQLKNELKVI